MRPEFAERFEREVLPLSDRMYCAAVRLAGNRQDAEDLLQETMLRAYSGFHTFRAGTNTSAWLYRVLHNAWINHHRALKRRPPEVSIERLDGRETLTVHGGPGSAEKAALESLPDEDIKAALVGLREQYRIAVYYADVEGLSHKEIASITGTAVGTVMPRIHRGRKQLRSSLREVVCRRRLVLGRSEQ